MFGFYVAEIKYYNECTDEEKTNYTLIAAESYSDAMSVVSEDWGEDFLISIKINIIGDENSRSLLISNSMADAFINDIIEDIICSPSEWRKKQMQKEIMNKLEEKINEISK